MNKRMGEGVLSLALLSMFLCTSCLEETGRDKCDPVYRVSLGVKDKNYSNAASVPGFPMLSEQLPFRSYVSNLTYVLRNVETGTIVRNMPIYAIANDHSEQTLDFSGVSPGSYMLSAFGNVVNPVVDKGGNLTVDLHAGSVEGMDTYLFSDTLVFTEESQTLHLDMQRTKGSLYVMLENLPDSVSRIEQQVFTVSQTVDQNSSYAGEATLKKSFTDKLLPSANLLTFLAPTPAGKNTTVRIALYAQGATSPFMFIPDFTVNIKQNEIAAFKLNFKPEGGVEIWIAMEGAWTKVHDVDIVTI